MKEQIKVAGALASIFTTGALVGGSVVWMEYQIIALQNQQAATVQELNNRILPEIQKKIEGVARK